MWQKIYNESRLWTICKDIDFSGGSPSYFESKEKELLLIDLPERKFVFVEYFKKNMKCYIKSGHRDRITLWEDGLDVRCYKQSDIAMKNRVQYHIDKMKELLV